MNKWLRNKNNDRVFNISIWIFSILCWSWNIYAFNTKILPYFQEQARTKSVSVSNLSSIKPILSNSQFEYCIYPTDITDPILQQIAGTPVPYEPVPIATQAIVEESVQITPQLESTPAPSPTKKQNYFNLHVVRPKNFLEENFHVVLVGVGYNGENDSVLQNIIDGLSKNFAGVQVDFAYVESSLDIDFKHIQQQVVFENNIDSTLLLEAIKLTYPVDSLTMAINTPVFLGTSNGFTAILTSSDPNAMFLATHEIAHQLSLDDGYQWYFDKGRLPNTELFYLDEVPLSLSNALNEIKETPPLYKVGTCDGRDVYSFYEGNNNIMRDYSPSSANSWGEGIFTPLQIQLMNDFVKQQ